MSVEASKKIDTLAFEILSHEFKVRSDIRM